MSWHVVPEHRATFCTAHLPDIPGVKSVRHTLRSGLPITLFRHDYQTWRQLRAAGLPVPSPEQYYSYPGRHKPRERQRDTVRFLLEYDKAFVLNGLGTGKTLSALWAADYLMRVGEVRRVLVVAPLRVCFDVWEKEIFQTVPDRKGVVLTGSRERKQQIARDVRFDYVIVNPESLHLIVDHLPNVDLVIADEFTKFKTARTRRWRALSAISRDTRLWLMSGTPAPQSPVDAHGPIRLVRTEKITLGQWRDLTMRQVTKFKWVPRDDAEQTIAKWMQPAVRFTREEFFDMPDVQTLDLEVELTKQQQDLIAELRETAAAELAGQQITAANAAVVLSKLLQVMSGGVYGYDEEGEQVTHRVDASPFFEAVEEIVDQADTPVLIFVPFRASAVVLHEYLQKQKFNVGRVLGGDRDARDTLDAFRRGELHALVATSGTISHGVDGLQQASRYLVWACPPYSYGEYDQANGRLIRSGQKNNVTIYHIVQNGLAKELFHRLKSKAHFQDTLLKLLEGELTA